MLEKVYRLESIQTQRLYGNSRATRDTWNDFLKELEVKVIKKG